MKNNIFLSFFFLVCFVQTNLLRSQTVTISQDMNVRNDNGYEIVGQQKGNILLFRDKVTDYEIVAFNEQMKIAWEKKIEFPEKRIQILDAIPGKDYFAVLYKGKEKGNSFVKIHRFDANVKFIDSALIASFKNRFLPVNPVAVFSEDQKMVLIYTFDQENKIEASVFDIENMKSIWTKTIPFQDLNPTEDFTQAIVSNRGEVFFTFEKSNQSTLFGGSTSELRIIESNASDIRYLNTPFVEQVNYDLRFAYDNSNFALNGVGLYSDKNKGKATGCFVLKLANNAQKLTFDTFDDELSSAIIGKKTSASKGIPDLSVREVIMRKDGGLVAILEETKQNSRVMGGMGTRFNQGVSDPTGSGRFVIDHFVEDLVAIAFNPDGTVQWRKVLPKKQFSQDDEAVFSSYGIMKTPNNVRLLFNDDINYQTTTSEYVVRGSGEVSRHSMFNTANQEILLRFQDGMQMNADEIIVPSEYRSRLRLVRLRY